MILEKGKVIFDKTSLGFNASNKPKFMKNMVVKLTIKNHAIIYFKCNKIGHKSIDCNV